MRASHGHDPRLVPDRSRPGSWIVRVGGADQSYIDTRDPTYLEFDYAQQIAFVIEDAFPPRARITAIHVGGAGMTIPRYIAYTRPTSGQIVFEPDATLTEAVREVAPLPRNSGIKVRPVDGRKGLAEIPDDYADLIVIDAFAGASVPPDLGTTQWFADVRRVLNPPGTLAMNITGYATAEYTPRILATIMTQFSPVTIGAEPSAWKGRHFGNFVIAAGPGADPFQWEQRSRGNPFPYRLLYGLELDRWVGAARPFTDDDSQASPQPPWGLTFFS
ncbi:MAG: fused MFS/spermidine synthase [Propionibacteriaceae bacterium]|nr:fused MFS/spermidine synthase [Propionibacteriaceae bacterium]